MLEIHSRALDQAEMAYAIEFSKSALETDLRYNCHVTNTDSFLSKVLPMQEKDISEIYDKLVAERNYDENTKQWHDFSIQQESITRRHFSRHFVDRAEVVRLACQDLVDTGLFPPGNDSVGGSWVGTADFGPHAPNDDNDGACIRPSIVNVSKPTAHRYWDERIMEVSKQTGSGEKVCRSGCPLNLENH